MKKIWDLVWGYVVQLFVAVDQVGNALIGGWADESISARAWRLHDTEPAWLVAMLIIDLMFIWQDWILKANGGWKNQFHCERAFISEKLRLQSPVEER